MNTVNNTSELVELVKYTLYIYQLIHLIYSKLRDTLNTFYIIVFYR